MYIVFIIQTHTYRHIYIMYSKYTIAACFFISCIVGLILSGHIYCICTTHW